MQSGSTPKTADYFEDLKLPSIEEMQLQLEQLVEAGALTPEEAQAELIGRSEMGNISTDPRFKQAQMDALLGLQDIGDGGLTAMDEANLNRIKSEENTASRGAREAIIQNANQRGMGGSGLELMAQLQNQQDSATRTSQRDMDVAGMAQERALQALIQGGDLGGKMQAQDFNQQAQVAGANDAISKFNAANKQNVNLTNVAARNNAQATNLNNKQNIMNQNVGTRNQQQQYNKELKQRQFENEMKKRSGQSGIAQANAQAQGQNSQNAANANNQMIGTIIGAGASMYGKKDGGMIEGEPTDYDSQPVMTQPGEIVIRKDDAPELLKRAHTDENGEFDAAAFLDTITGHKYGYSKKKKGA
jgi:hypothetical protein